MYSWQWYSFEDIYHFVSFEVAIENLRFDLLNVKNTSNVFQCVIQNECQNTVGQTVKEGIILPKILVKNFLCINISLSSKCTWKTIC